MKHLFTIILLASSSLAYGFEAADSTNNNGATDSKFKTENPHATRYFFAPTAINLKKGEGYYQNTYWFLHSVNYGVTDNISIGGGIVVPMFKFFQVYYFTPKMSIPIQKNWRVSVGAFATVVRTSDWDSNEEKDMKTTNAGILFANTTLGDENKNATLGLGYAYGNKNVKNTPILNINGMWRVSEKIVLISENHFFSVTDGDDGRDPIGIMSGGVRVLGKKLAFDLGLWRPVSKELLSESGILALPYFDVTFKWQKKAKK